MLKISDKLRRIIAIPLILLLVGSLIEEFTSLDFFSFSDEVNFKLIILLCVGIIFSINPSPAEREVNMRRSNNLMHGNNKNGKEDNSKNRLHKLSRRMGYVVFFTAIIFLSNAIYKWFIGSSDLTFSDDINAILVLLYCGIVAFYLRPSHWR